MLALSRARAGSCGLRCIACPSVRRSVLTSSLAMAAALRFAVLICLLCSCAVQPALAPSLSQDRPTERAAREGCATTRDGRGCAAAEAAAHHPRAGRTGIYFFFGTGTTPACKFRTYISSGTFSSGALCSSELCSLPRTQDSAVCTSARQDSVQRWLPAAIGALVDAQKLSGAASVLVRQAQRWRSRRCICGAAGELAVGHDQLGPCAQLGLAGGSSEQLCMMLPWAASTW